MGSKLGVAKIAATTWDHFIPVTKGGETVPGNMLPCCASCNSRKRNLDPWVWLQERAPLLRLEVVEYVSAVGRNYG